MFKKPSLVIASTILLLALWPSDGDKMRLGGVDPVELATTRKRSNESILFNLNSKRPKKSLRRVSHKHIDQFSQSIQETLVNTVASIKLQEIDDRIRLYRDYGSSLNNQSTSQIGKDFLSPVILLPGYGGSQLEARWSRPRVENIFCKKDSPFWDTIWVDFRQFLPFFVDCFVGMFKLNYDPITKTTHNAEGVEIRVKNPDDLTTIEYINDLRIPGLDYFAGVTRKLIEDLGYTRHENIRGAPYDFRKAPNELGDYFKKLRHTSEQMFEQSNGKQLTFICHSMGCCNILYFLQNQPQDWKDKYVRRVISLTAPWGGSVAALRAVALGDNLGKPYLLDEKKLNIAQRASPSTIYLLPHKRVFGNAPLIKSYVNGDEQKHVNYNALDYKQFFEDINHPDGYRMWLLTKDLLGNLQAPGVEIWCLYGKGRKTLGRLEFRDAFPHSEEIDLYDDGDGTVSVQSSKFCQEWSKEQTQPVHLKGFQASHIEMINNEQVLEFIERIMEDDDNVCNPEELQTIVNC